MTELPSGTVTFLFTDLEGSTRLWEEHPDAMQGALVRHDEIVRGAIESHGGIVYSEMGDGMAAVFASAESGVAAALDLECALETEPWGEVGAMRARMGLHAGEGVLRPDGMYMNPPLNRCARLMAVAHGGQVVISDAVEVLVRNGLAPEVGLVDLGEHRLRDLAQPVRVFQLTHPQLRREFPPLRSVDAYPGNLPVQLTSFVGRDLELAGIAKALDEWRMVTLTGVGGVGKTRLSVQVAAEVLPRFRDGAWLCELASADDDETMGQVVAAQLGVSQRPGMTMVASVSDYLRTKELLLVLDNCEQLLGPASDMAERVLGECPGVRILATSREGLGVGGEHVWPLRSLPLPNPTGADAAANDAVVLFTERAEAARASFALDASNAGAVAEICRRLDGIPLAIELAAARVVSMSPSEISGLLDERFRLLTGGRRKAVERHQTLRATVDWSYSLLSERERTVFDRLGVFVGSFDAPAAQAIVTGDPVEAWDVFDALTELVAKSMVVAEETAEGTTRYQMLETLGQYARERLDEHGNTDAWRRRQAEYFAGWAERAAPGLVGPDEFVWRAREQAELDNLRAVVTWAIDRDDSDDTVLALRIIGALVREVNWNPAAGVGAWADRALSQTETAPSHLRAATTAAAAQHQFNMGNYESARELARQAIDGMPNDAPSSLVAYSTIAYSELSMGRIDQGLATVLDLLRLIEGIVLDPVTSADVRLVASMLASMAADPIARSEAESALRLARESANPSTLAAALMAYGWALIADDRVAALAALDECVTLSRQGANLVGFGTALCLTAGIRVRSGDLSQGARDVREAIERAHQNNGRLTLYTSVLSGIRVVVEVGHLEQAAVFDGITSTRLTADYRVRAGLAHVQDAIERARVAYGPEAYNAAFHTGAAMPHDQVVEYALRVLDEVIDELDVLDHAVAGGK